MSRAGNHDHRRAYHVQAVLGTGGFGAVYRAKYVGEGSFSKIVALKVLHANMAAVDEVAMRMRDEARMLGLLRHRNIVQVDRLVQLNGHWTIVMEYVDGVDLKTIAHHTPLPIGPALAIVSEVASALHQAYSFVPLDSSIPVDERKPLEILHRDIKPANIQITRQGDVKVLDFGIARGNFDAREAKTQELFFGSPEYTAPERFDLEETPAGDIYSLGCVLYESLMGKPYGRTSARPAQYDELIEARLALLDESVLRGNADDVLALLADMLAYEGKERPNARDVERRCARLRIRHAEPLLREWAEDTLPALFEEREECPPDELMGTTLYEQITGGRPMAKSAPKVRKPPRKGPIAAPERQKARRSIREAFEEQLQQQAAPIPTPPRVAEPPTPQPPAPGNGAAPPPSKLDALPPPVPAPAPSQKEMPSRKVLPTQVVGLDFGQEASTDPGSGAPAGPGMRGPPKAAPTPHPAPEVEPPEPQPKATVSKEPKAAGTPRAEPAPPPPPAEPASKRRRPSWLLPVVGLATGGSLAVVMAVALFQLQQPATEPPPRESNRVEEPSGPAPTSTNLAGVTGHGNNQPEPPVEPEPTEKAPAPTPSAGTEKAEAPDQQTQQPVRPPPAPAPEPKEEDIAPAGTSMVHVQGQDLNVILEGDGGGFNIPGWVPPGTYTITAEFPGFGRTNSGSITVVAGAEATVGCDAMFGKCKQQ